LAVCSPYVRVPFGSWFCFNNDQESSENLVDVSTFVRPKTNTFRILQHSDMSAFVFALHAHLPTRQQLQAVTRQRKKAQQFRDDLKNWSRPVDVPLPPVWSSACTPSNWYTCDIKSNVLIFSLYSSLISRMLFC
jgi:hypothetical protein